MRYFYLTILFIAFMLFSSVESKASHLIGGGFTYTYLAPDRYLIEMEYIKDCSAGAAEYPPGQILIGIFRKSDHQKITTLLLNPGPVEPINVHAGSCLQLVNKCIQRRVYSDTLNTQTGFDDPSGYYMVHEQCCRNNGIKNIRTPGSTGMVFYAEFSPVSINGQRFINSSPSLKIDHNVYLCTNEPFSVNYGYADPDGDSISYKLAIPLAGNTNILINNNGGLNEPDPGPYDPIVWNTNYGPLFNDNIMDGNPDISIDSITGLVHIDPKKIGIYCFAIVIEEYRNGIKISEIRREIQYTIILCNVRYKPDLVWTNQHIQQLLPEEEMCFEFLGIDLNIDDTLSVHFLEVDEALKGKISIDFTKTKTPFQAKVCVKMNCEDSSRTSTGFKLILSDGSCPKPKLDTVEIALPFIGIENDPLDNIVNVFTPNNDGYNDYFFVDRNYPLICVSDFLINIYNRWGKHVFFSDKYDFRWSGDGLDAGIYFYVIENRGRKVTGSISMLY